MHGIGNHAAFIKDSRTNYEFLPVLGVRIMEERSVPCIEVRCRSGIAIDKYRSVARIYSTVRA